MRLQLMTWMEVEDYLKQHKGIIVPIGSTEQHGPIGLIGTDAICPEVIADKAAGTLGCIVGPTISIGMAQHHLAFPGSVALRPSRSEEHTSELQSLMRISYAVFCLKKKNTQKTRNSRLPPCTNTPQPHQQ